MRNVLRVFLAAVVLCMVLGSCAPLPPRQVSFMVSGDAAQLAAYQKLVDAFKAKYPDIQVDFRHVASDGDYQKQLVTAFSAGQQPDVMLLNHRRVAQFASQGGLQSVGDYLQKSTALHAADLYPQALEAFQWDGKTWCIPQNASSLVVYYNKKLFDAAGLAYPAAGWTWTDFVARAKALTLDSNGDGKTDQYGMGVSPELMRLAPFIWQNGGEVVDDSAKPTKLALDSPAAMQALQWFVNLQVKEHVAPDAAAEEATGSEDRFMQGTLAMFLNSRKSVPTYRAVNGLQWDVAALPQGLNPGTILHSDGYCLSAKSKDKEDAWKLIEFANSVEGQTLMSGTGRIVPSLRQVAESPAFLDPNQLPANSQVFLDVIPTLKRMPNLPQWSVIEETASREIERAFYGQATVQEAVNTAVSQTQQYFAPTK